MASLGHDAWCRWCLLRAEVTGATRGEAGQRIERAIAAFFADRLQAIAELFLVNAARAHVAIEIVAFVALHLGHALGARVIFFLGADIFAACFAVTAFGGQAGESRRWCGADFVHRASQDGFAFVSSFIGAALLGAPLFLTAFLGTAFLGASFGLSFLGPSLLGAALVHSALLGRRRFVRSRFDLVIVRFTASRKNQAG